MASTFLSRIIGLVRVKYIMWLFGSGTDADAFNAAFVLPDMISYFLVGGAASITFVTILTRYREAGREAEGERSLSVILTTMYLILGSAIVLAEIFAPWYVHWWFNGFDARKAAICVSLTRILLPAQLCFFAGGVFGAVLLVRKQFSVQAVAPLIYGLGTIVGGVLLVRRIGVSSLAIGTVGGAFCGPFLLNWIFARRAGTRYRPILDWHDEGLREWVRLSLPLMAGVSLVTADNWIIAHFASKIGGAVSLMSYAKQLFTAPMAMLAQAAGAASLPFFASLWTQNKRYEFATGVADSVSRVASLGLLVASAMIALGRPAIDLVLTGGRFTAGEARECAAYFAVFSLSLFLWSAQAIYARAFYAAGNTFVPMVAGTIVTLVSLPIYDVLYKTQGATGLAIASDVGIALQTLLIALLLHQRRMVSLASLDFAEMARCLLAAAVSGGAVALLAMAIGYVFGYLHGAHVHARVADLVVLIAGTALWLLLLKLILEKTGSALPRVAMKRLGLG
jgi:putative peptidoglycan lipid II flippase